MAESSVQHLLECPICQERFTQPKALSCQHTFCLSCLRGYVKDARHFNCPSCRQRQVVPKAGIQELKDNFLVNNLMEIVHETPPTATCPDCREEGQVLHECDHCEGKVCSVCRKKHVELVVEILAHFLSMMDKVLTEDDSWKSVGFSSLSISTLEEEEQKLKSSVIEAIDQTNAALNERQTEWLAQVDNVSRFRRWLPMGRVGAKISFQEEMKSCSSVEKLMILKDSLTQLDSARPFLKTLAKGSCPVLEVDVTGLRNFGDLYCEDIAFATSERGSRSIQDMEINQRRHNVQGISLSNSDIPSATNNEESLDEPDIHDGIDLETLQKSRDVSSPSDRREKRQLFPFNLFKRFGLTRKIDENPTNEGSTGSGQRDNLRTPATRSSTKEQIVENHQVLPFNVNYRSKRSGSNRQIINRQPASRRVIEPTCAVYCDHENAIYCIAKGELLCYDMVTLKGQQISGVENAKHLTIASSGKVIFTDGEIVKSLGRSGTQWTVRPIVGGFNNLTQLCCLGKNILVLDVSGTQSRITSFSEEGDFVREYGTKRKFQCISSSLFGDIYLNDSSRMCVDREGRIYVSSVRIKRKNDENWDGGCGLCRVSKSVKVNWEVEITVLTPIWSDYFNEKLVVEAGSKEYHYDFTGPRYRCLEGKWLRRRDDKSIPDNRAIRESLTRGICVDGDGYISVSRPGKNQIDVYVEKEYHRRNMCFYSLVPVRMRSWSKLPLTIVMFPVFFIIFVIVVRVLSVVDRAANGYFGILLVSLTFLFTAYDMWLAAAKPVATIQGFDKPNSVSLTPDGKMIVCDKKGINIIE